MKIVDELSYLLFPPTQEDAFARQIFAQLQSGQLDHSVLGEDLSHFLTPIRLQEYKTSLSPLGPVQSFSFLREQTTDGLTNRDYEVLLGGRRLHFHLLLLPDKKLEDVTVSPVQ